MPSQANRVLDDVQLCTTCQAIFDQVEPDFNDMLPHHSNRAELEEAVRQGCFLCTAFLGKLRSFPNIESRLDDGMFWTIFGGGNESPSLSVSLSTESGDILADFELEPAQVLEPLLAKHDIPNSTASKECLQQVKRWLETCQKNHKYCGSANDDLSWVPTRLIDCHEPATGADEVNVVETAKVNVTGPYMTISHRWGDRNVPMLTSAMLRGNNQYLLVQSLPQSFQDAIAVARELGIRYLWIDCLCILQDSPDDFQTEASQMHNVYGNSYCNISATGAPTNRESLFNERQQQSLWPKYVEVKWGSSITTRYCLFGDAWKEDIVDAPVNHRGWIVQERYLAPRVIHFAKQQLFYECSELRACEVFPTRLPSALAASARFKGGLLASKSSANVSDSKSRALEAWTTILESYSRSHLTQPSDKLIAIAGVANRMHEVLQDDYLAGLWHSTLLTELLWYGLPDTCEGTRRPEVYRAPSWSWASVDGRIESFEPRIQVHPCCTVLEASVSLKTSFVFGEVTAGLLRLQGHITRVEVDQGFCFSNQTDPTVKINGLTVSDLIYSMDDPTVEEVTQAWCICLQHDLSELTKRAGLILKSVDGARGVFARIGIFTLGGADNIKIFEATDALDPVSVPSESHHTSTSHHIITVI